MTARSLAINNSRHACTMLWSCSAKYARWTIWYKLVSYDCTMLRATATALYRLCKVAMLHGRGVNGNWHVVPDKYNLVRYARHRNNHQANNTRAVWLQRFLLKPHRNTRIRHQLRLGRRMHNTKKARRKRGIVDRLHLELCCYFTILIFKTTNTYHILVPKLLTHFRIQ